MPDTTRPSLTGTGPRVSGYYRGEAHRTCQPGPVVTRYGDVALVIHCACTCHKAVTR